ncbi:hypothetical protein ACFE04_017678 [Oxalis oulophora]
MMEEDEPNNDEPSVVEFELKDKEGAWGDCDDDDDELENPKESDDVDATKVGFDCVEAMVLKEKGDGDEAATLGFAGGEGFKWRCVDGGSNGEVAEPKENAPPVEEDEPKDIA